MANQKIMNIFHERPSAECGLSRSFKKISMPPEESLSKHEIKEVIEEDAKEGRGEGAAPGDNAIRSNYKEVRQLLGLELLRLNITWFISFHEHQSNRYSQPNCPTTGSCRS